MASANKWLLLAAKILLTLAFLGAGFAKLSGQEMMVATFDAVGLGQWFRYVTGAIEVGGAVALWVKGYTGWAAALLGATMVGAVLAHLLIDVEQHHHRRFDGDAAKRNEPYGHRNGHVVTREVDRPEATDQPKGQRQHDDECAIKTSKMQHQQHAI